LAEGSFVPLISERKGKDGKRREVRREEVTGGRKREEKEEEGNKRMGRKGRE